MGLELVTAILSDSADLFRIAGALKMPLKGRCPVGLLVFRAFLFSDLPRRRTQ